MVCERNVTLLEIDGLLCLLILIRTRFLKSLNVFKRLGLQIRANIGASRLKKVTYAKQCCFNIVATRSNISVCTNLSVNMYSCVNLLSVGCQYTV